MVRHMAQGLGCIGQWQEIVEKFPVVGRPCQMLGKAIGLIAVAQGFEAREMGPVEWPRAADRQSDPMNGQSVIGSEMLKHGMRQSARAHIIFGMDFNKIQRAAFLEQVIEMLGFEADTDAGL